MMPFLTVNTTDITCDYGAEATSTPTRVAKQQRAMSGRLRVAQRAEKRTFVVQTVPLTSAERTAVKALVNAFQSCSGDLTGSITCWVELTKETPADALATRWRLFLRLVEQ